VGHLLIVLRINANQASVLTNIHASERRNGANQQKNDKIKARARAIHRYQINANQASVQKIKHVQERPNYVREIQKHKKTKANQGP
jgi:hypothetical protein